MGDFETLVDFRPPAESKEHLTTLAPDIVAAILNEILPPHVTVHELAISPPVLWEEQRERIGVVGELPSRNRQLLGAS